MDSVTRRNSSLKAGTVTIPIERGTQRASNPTQLAIGVENLEGTFDKRSA